MAIGSFSSRGDLRYKGGSRSTSKKRSHMIRAENTRRVLPGYPRETPFENYSEMNEYFEGDKIECLRCGKLYKSIGVHLRWIHNILPDEYREYYRIPWTRKLTCKPTKQLKSRIGKELHENGVGGLAMMSEKDKAETRAHATHVMLTKGRENIYKKEVGRDNLGKLAVSIKEGRFDHPSKGKGKLFRTFSDEYIINIIEKMGAEDITLRQSCKVNGGIKHGTILDRISRDTKLKEIYNKNIDKLSFKTQARMNKLRKKFYDAVYSSIKNNNNLVETSEALNMSYNTVSVAWMKIKQSKNYNTDSLRVKKVGGKVLFTKDDSIKMIEIMGGEDLLLKEACRKHEGPGPSVVQRHIAKYTDLRKLYEDTKESLSFETQKRGHILGERFHKEIIRLRKEGLLQKEIAEKFNMHENSIQSLLNRIKNK